MDKPRKKVKPLVTGRKRVRPGLLPSRIASEALALVDESGLEHLSMRALASRLGVEAMSLYHHFPSKEALLTAVSRVLEDEAAALWVKPPADWRDRIIESGRIQMRTILAHPRAVPLVTARMNPGGSGYITTEALLRALADAGLDANGRQQWARSIVALINGTGAYFVPLTSAQPEGILAPDPRLFPLTAEAIARRGRMKVDPDRTLERGLRALIAAIEAEVAAGRHKEALPRRGE